MKILENYNSPHFIGIGGVHMSALAEMLYDAGYSVSGSDWENSAVTSRLQNRGIDVIIGHSAQNIPVNCDLVVYNSAINPNNDEFAEAMRRKLPTMGRATLLGLAMKSYEIPICIAGTHGKTTTTSMLAEIFLEAGKNPTIMNGGILPKIGTTLHIGKPPFFIAEACEYHDNFLSLYPHIGIILNMDYDHSDYFADYDNMADSFEKFANIIPENGTLIINAETKLPNITGRKCKNITFGESGEFWAKDIKFNNDIGNIITNFTLMRNQNNLGEISMKVLGQHNIENALAAIACAYVCGLTFEEIRNGLSGFSGAVRRFQRLGNFKGATVVDDYAHHPVEIAATISAAQNLRQNRTMRIIPIFQPHTRKRTEEFLQDFAVSLSDGRIDFCIILDIYNPAGRENDDCKIHSKDLVSAINKMDGRALYFSEFDKALEFLENNIEKDDLLITMGAGDVYKLGEKLVK
ncbi:MAG: UDP-N-acetylmuramate--L-alanine ligase [Defluviitaleaceae bacterium]|nr:UDP-N-acetylmuramate--L-alanine ligase [Defluviitaleaceae bacterium]